MNITETISYNWDAGKNVSEVAALRFADELKARITRNQLQRATTISVKQPIMTSGFGVENSVGGSTCFGK
jgi:hypothetical protein